MVYVVYGWLTQDGGTMQLWTPYELSRWTSFTVKRLFSYKLCSCIKDRFPIRLQLQVQYPESLPTGLFLTGSLKVIHGRWGAGGRLGRTTAQNTTRLLLLLLPLPLPLPLLCVCVSSAWKPSSDCWRSPAVHLSELGSTAWWTWQTSVHSCWERRVRNWRQ